MKVLFVDFDGTLFDTMPTLWLCYEVFLKNHGIFSADHKDFESFIGSSLSEVVVELKKRYSLNQDADELLLHYESLVAKAYQENVFLFPGAFECLDAFKRKNITTAIVTSAPKKLVEFMLKRESVFNFFDAIFSPIANEATKPDPAIYLRALKEIKALPRDAIAIEDSQAGLKSALNAGIKTFHFSQEKTWFDVRAFVVEEFDLY